MIKVEMTFATAEEAADAMCRLAGDAPAETGDGSTAQPRKRRRTKAEMDAARAAEAAGGDATEGAAEQAQAQAEPAGAADDDFLGPDPAAKQAVSETPENRKPPLTKEEAEAMFKTEVRPALGAVMTAKGQDAARKLLEDFGFKKLTDMPSERYAEFIAVCKQAA
ncbi:hypothetical protein [Methylobacterium sp. 391_Methyba4]|uniref:hypothetical protein n=1 Tax=Methylobacterium sp. 391_Methyba4 TaxID=3038924 RepID=UPI00241BE912|nr:hypothetical protein [Methylobacterium sp. 391_Methyba4]WFS07746.1 hypothetical protein P9K36_00115 [Methylobacterium sp. 391_Methyba4]